jgi:hypothetical protein
VLEFVVNLVVKGDFPLVANGSRNLAVPFTALFNALGYDFTHIDNSHLGQIDINLLEYATLTVFLLAGLAVLWVTSAPAHERLAFVFFFLQLGLLATPRQYLSRRYLGPIGALAVLALVVVARRRILYM